MKIGDHFHAFMWHSMSANNSNCYLIDGALKILIDPGHRALFQHVENGLRRLDMSVEDIDVVLCTHAHPDHIESVVQVKAAGAKFGLHHAEWDLVKEMLPRMTNSSNDQLAAITPDFFLQEGELVLGDTTLQVYHTPGHSPGSVCLFSAPDGVLVTGDLIFKDGFGRTDLPGGDSQVLKESLAKMAQVPAEFVLPGHGNIISGKEKVTVNHERIERLAMQYL